MKRLCAIAAFMFLYSAMFFVAVCAGGDQVTRPSKGMWSGTLYTLGPCANSTETFQVINVGKGYLTTAGESDWLSEVCVFLDSATSMAGSGWGIITGANGDAIHLSIEVRVDLATTPHEWSETELIVGGTGRFKDATGYGESGGTWTSGIDPFPFGTAPPMSPLLLQAPQGWEGTSRGEITF